MDMESSTKSDFTFEGYNNEPKPCQEKVEKNKKCSGTVYPTWNADMGICNKCNKSVSWESLSYISGIGN